MNTNDDKTIYQSLKAAPDNEQADTLLLIPSNMTLSAITNGIGETFRYFVNYLNKIAFKKEFYSLVQESTESRSIHALIARGTVKWYDDLNVEFTIDNKGKKAILFNKFLNWSLNLLLSIFIIVAIIDHAFIQHFQTKIFTSFISSISRFHIINEISFYILFLSSIVALFFITLNDIKQTVKLGKIEFKGKVVKNNGDFLTLVSEDYEYIVKFSNQDRITKVVPELNYFYCFYLLFFKNIEVQGLSYFFGLLICSYFFNNAFIPMIFLLGLVFFLSWIFDELISKRIQRVKEELNIKLPEKDSPANLPET